MEPLQVGDLVESLRGRDCGSLYIVVSLSENNFVNLANGHAKKLENTKLKNAKHLKKLSYSAILNSKLSNDDCIVYDSEIYSFIRKYKVDVKE